MRWNRIINIVLARIPDNSRIVKAASLCYYASNVTDKTSLIHEGVITMTKSGIGFFPLPGAEGSPKSKKRDLFIPREWNGGAFPYDIVKVEEQGTVDGRVAAKVIEVVTRSRTRFVGTLVQQDGKTLLMPDWKKMYTPFLMRGDNLPLDNKVLIRFDGWNPGEEYPSGILEEIIGVAGLHETEMRAVALAAGFESEFPPNVLKEAEHLEEHGKEMLAEGAKDPRRKDFRNITTFTIDPADAKDFDDALSVRELEDGTFEIGVHIADVSHFVRNGNPIDGEARKRATSVYLVDRTIPMLPHVLSTNLCSLNPNEDRLAVSAVFILDKQAGVLSRWFGETVIYSDKRFTYEDAQAVLDTNEGPYLKELSILKDLAEKIRARRVKNGMVEFDSPEVKIELDEAGKPIKISLKQRKATNLLIEDFMLLANEAVAEFLAETTKRQGIKDGVIYRVHDVPDADRIETLSQFLKVLGYQLHVTAGGVRGVDLNELMEQLKGKPEEYLIKSATLRSMSKAIYTTKNAGHFGLAFDFYTHFTSPIRRYPDLLIHRLLKHIVHKETLRKDELDELETLAIHSSEREVAASEAERDSIKLKQVEYLVDHIGEEFDAVISGVTERGIYVEEQTTRADGMVNVRNLGNDFYTYDEKRYRLFGERTHTSFALGDKVRVKLIAARPFERELDFALVQ